MKRSQLILSVVAAILIVALFYLLLYSPQRDELAELEIQITAEQALQAELEVEIARLRAVRETAPEVEAELAAAEAIVPQDPGLPSALRQLQLAADESGVVLESVSTARPAPIDGPVAGLAGIDVSMQMSGRYFQLVDFLRRVEDPAITPRGLTWGSVAVTRAEYPDLTASINARMYVLGSTPPAPEVDPAPTEGLEEGTEGDSESDAVEAELQTEDVT